jgi:hypothetical protein
MVGVNGSQGVTIVGEVEFDRGKGETFPKRIDFGLAPPPEFAERGGFFACPWQPGRSLGERFGSKKELNTGTDCAGG